MTNSLADPWAEFRRQMPIAAPGPILTMRPSPAAAGGIATRLVRYANEAAEQGDTVWPRWNQRLQQVRQLAARLMVPGRRNCRPAARPKGSAWWPKAFRGRAAIMWSRWKTSSLRTFIPG